MAAFVSNVSTLVESGLRGPALTGRRALALRLGAVVAFLVLWSLLAGLVVGLKLFNPIFLPGPWLVVGSLVELAGKGQLWVHVRATLERVAIGFATGAGLGLALGLAAGHLREIGRAHV